MHVYANNAETTLDVAIDEVDTVLTTTGDDTAAGVFAAFVAPGGGFGMPVTLTHGSMPGVFEIVFLESIDSLDFTVVRGYEDTIPQAWPTGTLLSARVTARMLGDLLQRDPATGIVRATDPVGGTDKSFALGAGAMSADVRGSNALLLGGRSRTVDGIQLSGWPTLQKLRSSAGGGTSFDRNVSYESWGGTIHVDLGTAVAWAADNVYQRGMVVSPTTPDGFQYWLDVTSVENSGSSSAGAEPTWNTSGATAVNNGNWYPTELPVNISSGNMRNVLITEVGFICDKYTASSPPVVDIGTPSAPTRFANGVTLSQITGDNCVHRIILATGGEMVNGTSLVFAVDTAATGGRCMGRFYWRGLFIEAGENS